MPPRVNKKLLMIIVGSMLVLTVGLTVWYWFRSRGEVQQAAGRQEARDLIERGEMRRAMFTLEELVRQKPEDVQSRIELAKVYAQQNEPGKSYNQWRTVLRYDVNNLEAWQQVGKYVSQSRQWNELEAAAQHILELSKDDPGGLLYMAQACLGQGTERLPDALDYATRAVAAGPNNPQTHLTLARVYLVQGADDEVRKAIDDALVQLPESQEVWQFLGQYEAELARRSQVKKEPEQTQEHRAKAEEAFAKALEHADNPVDGHLQLARYYNDSGKKDDAEKHFEEAVKVAQTQEEKLLARRAYGDYCAQERRWDDALKQYDEALIAWPKHREILIKKARIYLTQRKSQEAKLALDEVKNQGRRDIFHVQALHLNGFRLLSEGRNDEAIEELTTALTMVRD
ncbi:MAG TPA: tetratricopeptide repeat protein, partial [Planctomycetota bacterium]|nr:tetratricopeptide repeat protein [Planctomycetota bacterium]